MVGLYSVLPPALALAAAVAAAWLAPLSAFDRWWLVLTLWGASLAAALVLSLRQLGRLRLPGCGAGGGCDELTGGRWGKIGGWPVSFLGTAFFAALWAFALSAGWREPLPGLLLLAVAAGGAGSLFFIGVMAAWGHVCPYCIAVHTGNLAACGLLSATGAWQFLGGHGVVGAVVGLGVFAATALLLGSAQTVAREASAARREREFQRSLRRIRRHLHRSKRHPGLDPVVGRWWRGPLNAPVRLVVFSDYQCPDCRRAELQLRDALAGRCDVSVGYKHFPLSRECNPRVRSPGDHRHACRAARIAETAGRLGQTDGFLRMHAWLFRRKAEFTDEELAEALPGLGFTDVATFFRVSNDPAIAEQVKRDVEEGQSLRLAGTPALFVNGVPLQGATADRAVLRLVEAVGQGNAQQNGR